MIIGNMLKVARETATGVTSTAKTVTGSAVVRVREQKAKLDNEKAVRDQLRAERLAAAAEAALNMQQEIKDNCEKSIFDVDSALLVEFAREFRDKLVIPAGSETTSNITWYPRVDKINKIAAKRFYSYSSEEETPIFIIKKERLQSVLLTTKALYFRKSYGEDGVATCAGVVPIEHISSLSYEKLYGRYVFRCNGVDLLDCAFGFEPDTKSIADFAKCLAEKKLTISNEQIDAVIREKIGEKIYRVIREYMDSDELLLYFAWGNDSVTAKDFVVCTDKQMLVLDREVFGLTKSVRQLYYDDINSMAMLQHTKGVFDFVAAAVAGSCTLEITVSGAKEKVEHLFAYEAEKVIRVYRECKTLIKKSNRSVAAPDGPVDVLAKLAKLRDDGVITEEEFKAKKEKLLKKI